MRAEWWLVVLAGALAGSCLNAQPAFRTLAKGEHSGMTKAIQTVIRTPEEWQKLWKEHGGPQVPAPPLPKVDFSREMVIAVYMGQQTSGGYGVEVTGVQAGDKGITVQVKRSQPPPGAIVTAVITEPFHLVAVRRSDLPVKFVAAPGR